MTQITLTDTPAEFEDTYGGRFLVTNHSGAVAYVYAGAAAPAADAAGRVALERWPHPLSRMRVDLVPGESLYVWSAVSAPGGYLQIVLPL